MKKMLCGLYGCVMIGIFGLDRITKLWALSACALKPLVMNSFLSCFVVYNRGVAWSIGASDRALFFGLVTCFVALTTVVVASMGYTRYKEHKNSLGECIIVAGSLGNLYDRFTTGGVIDFIECSYQGWYWPSFNIADMAIVSGVAIVIYYYYKEVV